MKIHYTINTPSKLTTNVVGMNGIKKEREKKHGQRHATSCPGRFSLAFEVGRGQGKAPWARGWKTRGFTRVTSHPVVLVSSHFSLSEARCSSSFPGLSRSVHVVLLASSCIHCACVPVGSDTLEPSESSLLAIYHELPLPPMKQMTKFSHTIT